MDEREKLASSINYCNLTGRWFVVLPETDWQGCHPHPQFFCGLWTMDLFRKSSEGSFVLGLLLLVIHTVVKPPLVFGQLVEFPFANPQKFLGDLFGEDTESERADLEKIEITVSEEQKFGQQLVAADLALLKESGVQVVAQGRDVEYLKSLVDTLLPFMKNRDRYPSIRVLVAHSRKIDARSYPGGTLIFFEGLLDAARNEAALAGIVGHELSHLDRGHQLLPIRRLKLMERSVSTPVDFTELMKPNLGLAKLWARPFRPEDERAADRDGVAWSFAAGYDPREMTRFFRSNDAVTPPEPEDFQFAPFFRSHPADHERKAAMLRQFQELKKSNPPPATLFIGRENLIKRYSRKQVEDSDN